MKLFKHRASSLGWLVLGSLIPLTFAGSRRGRRPAGRGPRNGRLVRRSRRRHDHEHRRDHDQRRSRPPCRYVGDRRSDGDWCVERHEQRCPAGEGRSENRLSRRRRTPEPDPRRGRRARRDNARAGPLQGRRRACLARDRHRRRRSRSTAMPARSGSSSPRPRSSRRREAASSSPAALRRATSSGRSVARRRSRRARPSSGRSWLTPASRCRTASRWQEGCSPVRRQTGPAP